MGLVIDHNHRYTQEERDYLNSRGRGYLIPANERRFGTNESPKEPEPFEQHDSHAISPFYQNATREAAVYDKGGAPLPNTTLDYNTGRVADRNNGVTVEYAGPGHTPGASNLSQQRDMNYEPEGFVSYGEDDGDVDIDEDIVEEVLSHKTVAALKKALKEHDVDVEAEWKKEDLENALAVALQDQRDAAKAQA
jgi:hypothetical protein